METIKYGTCSRKAIALGVRVDIFHDPKIHLVRAVAVLPGGKVVENVIGRISLICWLLDMVADVP
jgi:hypothetical protein